VSTTRSTVAEISNFGDVILFGKHPDSVDWKNCQVSWRVACDICTPMGVADDVCVGERDAMKRGRRNEKGRRKLVGGRSVGL
jgi:hypothetical protein